VKEALGFRMKREIAHQQSLEKRCIRCRRIFRLRRLAGMPGITNVYFNLSTGEGARNANSTFDYRKPQPCLPRAARLVLRLRGKFVMEGFLQWPFAVIRLVVFTSDSGEDGDVRHKPRHETEGLGH
jgi:hypothetical protein